MKVYPFYELILVILCALRVSRVTVSHTCVRINQVRLPVCHTLDYTERNCLTL